MKSPGFGFSRGLDSQSLSSLHRSPRPNPPDEFMQRASNHTKRESKTRKLTHDVRPSLRVGRIHRAENRPFAAQPLGNQRGKRLQIIRRRRRHEHALFLAHALFNVGTFGVSSRSCSRSNRSAHRVRIQAFVSRHAPHFRGTAYFFPPESPAPAALRSKSRRCQATARAAAWLSCFDAGLYLYIPSGCRSFTCARQCAASR